MKVIKPDNIIIKLSSIEINSINETIDILKQLKEYIGDYNEIGLYSDDTRIWHITNDSSQEMIATLEDLRNYDIYVEPKK